MSVLDEMILLVIALAIAAVVLVGLMVALYAWALRRRRSMDEQALGEGEVDYPPDGRYDL